MNGPAENGETPPPGTNLPRVPMPRGAAEDGPLPEVVPVPPPPPSPDQTDQTDQTGTANPADTPARTSPESAREPERAPAREPAQPQLPPYEHRVLRSLLGAWALSACSHDEAGAVELHLIDCAPCAEEALRLRRAVGLLHQEESLDLDPLLRARVLEGCLGRRPARIPVPAWAAPYDAETARLDALLADLGEPEWDMPVKLVWAGGARELTLCGVLAHLGSVDGVVATALGLDDPLGPGAPRTRLERTELAGERCRRHTHAFVRNKWRTQTRDIVRTLSFAGSATGGLPVDFADAVVPMRDALIDRAFECWIHAEDIAQALDYPEYGPPAAPHLNRMIDLAARMLPTALAALRQAGLAESAARLVRAGAPGRTLDLHVEGSGGGHWYISLDSPGAIGTPETVVAEIAVDQLDFCQLAAGHISPARIAAGRDGDRAAIRDVLHATASLSRL